MVGNAVDRVLRAALVRADGGGGDVAVGVACNDRDRSSDADRAGLDRDAVRNEIARGLSGADDGELFLEYRQSEMLGFDNGRLKQATYDTSQGFGLRAVKDDAVGYAHSSDVSLPALIRAADAVHAVRGGYSGTFAAAPAHTNVRLYGDENPLDAPGFESKIKLLAEIDAAAEARGYQNRSEIIRDLARAGRVMGAMMKMTKVDIQALKAVVAKKW